MATCTRESIDRFLAAKRIAAIGASRDPRHFSRTVMAAMAERGYDVIPVNPNASDIGGQPCYPEIGAVTPVPDAAILFTTGEATDKVTRQCAAAGVPLIWMYRAVGHGAVTSSAVDFCHDHGIDVVPGECPFMFLPDTGWPHRLHGFIRKLTGTMPA